MGHSSNTDLLGYLWNVPFPTWASASLSAKLGLAESRRRKGWEGPATSEEKGWFGNLSQHWSRQSKKPLGQGWAQSQRRRLLLPGTAVTRHQASMDKP